MVLGMCVRRMMEVLVAEVKKVVAPVRMVMVSMTMVVRMMVVASTVVVSMVVVAVVVALAHPSLFQGTPALR